jgi:hypothetical protein
VKRSTIVAAGLSVFCVGLAVTAAAQEIMPTPTPTPVGEVVTPPASRVTASTHDGNVPGNTVDGNLGTRWSGRGDGAWIEYDLGATTRLFEVQVAVYKGDTRRNRFELVLSTNRTTWRTVFSGQSSGATTSLERYRFTLQDARYVRYVGHGHVTNTGVASDMNSLTEVVIVSNQTRNIVAPAALQVSPIYDAGAIMLRWTAGGITRHNVFRSTTPTGPYTHIISIDGTQYTDWGLQNNVRYCYVVSSGNGAFFQHSRYSNEGCATASVLPTPPPPRPDPPTNLTAQHGAVGCDGFVTVPLRLSWTAGARSTSFNVYRGSAAVGPFTKITNVTTTQYAHNAMTSGWWVVTGVNGAGESDHSNVVFGTFAVPGCPQPPKIMVPASAVTVSTHDGNVGPNAVDNNLSTRWSGYGDGATLQIDLGGVRTVTHFRISVYRGDERRNRFDIQISNDPAAGWATVWSGESSGTTTGLQTIDLVDSNTRFIRYLGHGNVSVNTGALNGWNSVNELELYGY